MQKQSPEVFYEKKLFLEISQNSQENTCATASFLIKLQAASLRYKQFLVPFIDSSSRPEEFLKISQNQL